MNPHAPQFFEPTLVDETQAAQLWYQCIRVADRAIKRGGTQDPVNVNRLHGELAILVGQDGKLVRFWLRAVLGNALVIVGNRDGLLPLNVGPVHV